VWRHRATHVAGKLWSPPKRRGTVVKRTRERVGRLGWIQIDCADPERLAAFWSEMLGVSIVARLGDPPQFVNLGAAGPGSPQVCFQRVPEPKVVKNRLHLDIEVADVETASARVETSGGRRRDDHDFHEHGYSWRRMADPDGNEFCLIYDT
jgi:predicted enzyme related to lactoylglutathione lyase